MMNTKDGLFLYLFDFSCSSYVKDGAPQIEQRKDRTSSSQPSATQNSDN